MKLDTTENIDNEEPHIEAHKASFKHRKQIEKSTECGCFYCLHTFHPQEINLWWDAPENTPDDLYNSHGLTATCPRCGIDSVIGSASGYPLTKEFLEKMRIYWFGFDGD